MFALIGCVIVMFLARLLGPSALQRYDQPRTASYTTDIVANGHWLLPHDILGRTATKPPLVNWLAAPLVMLGFWNEWAVKAPMLIASFVTLGLTISMGRRLLKREPDASSGAFLAGIAWLVNPASMSMIYHCRPDPVLIAFLTAAWILGTRIILEKDEPPFRIVVAFWVCVGLASLTKGPAALLPILYLPLAARFIGGRWSVSNRSRWWWGLPLAVGIFLAWAVPCALRYPDAFFNDLIGREFIAQTFGLGQQFGNHRLTVTSEGPIAVLKSIHQNPLWFLGRFAPWSLAAVGTLCVIGFRRWLRHPLAPAILWLLLVLAFFALSAHKTADYIQPAYPAAAVLAAWFCTSFLRRYRIQAWRVAMLSLGLAFYLAVDSVFFSVAARNREGDSVKEFGHGVREIVHDEPLLFADSGYNTVQLFLGRHQPEPRPSAEEIAQAKWIVLPLLPDQHPELISKPLPTKPQSKHVVLGLYRISDVRERIPLRDL